MSPARDHEDRTDDSAGSDFPAAEIEQLVSDRVHRGLSIKVGLFLQIRTSARLATHSISSAGGAAQRSVSVARVASARKRAVPQPEGERSEVSVDQSESFSPTRLNALLDTCLHIPGATDDETEICRCR